MQCRTITNALTARKLPMKMRAGRGCFYLEYNDGKVFESRSVMACRIADFTLGEWIAMGVEFADELKRTGRA